MPRRGTVSKTVLARRDQGVVLWGVAIRLEVILGVFCGGNAVFLGRYGIHWLRTRRSAVRLCPGAPHNQRFRRFSRQDLSSTLHQLAIRIRLERHLLLGGPNVQDRPPLCAGFRTVRQTNRSRACNVVKNLRGVDQVTNNIEVLPLGRMDMQIRACVRLSQQRTLTTLPGLARQSCNTAAQRVSSCAATSVLPLEAKISPGNR
jgi:hypothetical protein